MKRGMNRNGRKKEARAIFLIMKTLLCVSFCFVVRGCYSNRALSGHPDVPPPPQEPRYVHPLAAVVAAATIATTTAATTPARTIFFFYIITCGSLGRL